MEGLFRFSLYRIILPFVIGGALVELLFRIYYHNFYFPSFYILSLLNGNLIYIAVFLFWVLGIIFMYSSEVILFYIFDFNTFNYGNYIERISPLEKRKLYFTNFSSVRNEILEFSEINYVISVFLISIHMLLLSYCFGFWSSKFAILPILILILLEIVMLLYYVYILKRKCLNKLINLIKIIYPMVSTIIPFIGVMVYLKHQNLLIFIFSFLQFLSFILAIRFRIFANKLLYYR